MKTCNLRFMRERKGSISVDKEIVLGVDNRSAMSN